MSWIDKELKKRHRGSAADGTSTPGATLPPVDPMQGLWTQLERSNAALPERLRLQRVDGGAPPAVPDPLQPYHFLAWLRASNGAALGFTGDAVRYVWPERAFKRSRNFWIRWSAEHGFRVYQRLGAALSPEPRSAEGSFDERWVEEMIRRLVVGKRITLRTVRKRRLWLF